MSMTLTKDEIKDIISNDIDTKLHVFAMTEQLSDEPKVLREQLRIMIIRTVESWGFVPGEVIITGPNDDKEIDIKWNLGLASDGINTVTGVKMDL